MFRLVLTVSQHHWVTRTKPVSLSYSNYIAVAQHKICDVDLSFNVEVKLEQMMHLQSDKMHMKVTRASHACVWTVLVWDIKCLSQTLSKPSGGSHTVLQIRIHTPLCLWLKQMTCKGRKFPCEKWILFDIALISSAFFAF